MNRIKYLISALVFSLALFANATVTINNPATGTPSSSSGSGTVTSVDMSVPSILSISGNPITTSGTLALSLGSGVLPAANGGANSSGDIINCSVGITVASHAITAALLDGAGGALSASSPCVISFRSSTAATGTYAQVITSAASAGVNTVVGSNGSQLGCPTAAVVCTISIYAINNGGTVELAFYHGGSLDEGSVQTSTVLAGSGADDADYTLWSTSARASKAVRFLARVNITPAAAFAWDNAVTEISNIPFAKPSWFINATFTGGDPDITAADHSASFTELTNGSLTLTPRLGSAPVGTMCSSTNAATAPSTGATTCGAGNESLGINFAIPSPGRYKVCFQGGSVFDLQAAAVFQPTFAIIETATNAQTALTTPGGAVGFVQQAPTAAVEIKNGFQIAPCDVFDWSGIAGGTIKGVRLMNALTSSGTITQALILCDAANLRSCGFTVERVNN